MILTFVTLVITVKSFDSKYAVELLRVAKIESL